MDSQQRTVMESPIRNDSGFLSLGNTPISRGGSFYSINGDEELPMDVDNTSNQSHAQRCSPRNTTPFLRDGSESSGPRIVATIGIKGSNDAKATVTQELKNKEGEQPKRQTAYLTAKPSDDSPDGPVLYDASPDPPDPGAGEILGSVTIDGMKINGDGAEQIGQGIERSQEQSPQPQLPLFGHGVRGSDMRFGGCGVGQQMPIEQQAWWPRAQNEHIQIFVVDHRGKTHTLRVKRTDMVDDLMRYVQKKIGVAQSQQRLHYGGKDLVKGMSLKHYGIEEESTVHQTGRLRGGSSFADNTIV